MSARRYPGVVSSEFVRRRAFVTSAPLTVEVPMIAERCVH